MLWVLTREGRKGKGDWCNGLPSYTHPSCHCRPCKRVITAINPGMVLATRHREVNQQCECL